jgi:fatty acid desaturase
MSDSNEHGGRHFTPEWPTLLLAAIIYGGWMAATWWHDRLPPWILLIIGGWLVAWHGSLQHETIHGHPSGIRLVDGLIGGVPLALWLPYRVYRRTHLDHHAARVVTDPIEDPESRYLGTNAGIRRQLLWFSESVQAPLAGRLVLGPPLSVARFWLAEVGRAVKAPMAVLSDWFPHLLGVAAVLAWLHFTDVGTGFYLLAFVYPGIALSLLRSFAEHRAGTTRHRRVAVVEKAGPLALLFLHNNLHAAHHLAPSLAWYRLPGFYKRHRPRIVAANGGLVYKGYWDIVRRYMFHPHDGLLHPDHRSEARST